MTHKNKVNRSRGLGDTIAKATSAIGIKPCGGCKKRQKWLNKMVPYQQSPVRLSAVLPARQEGDEVRLTCESLLKHGVNEIIVVDDGSTDGCCKGLPEEVVVLRNSRAVGVPQARNQGAAAATGDVLLFVDAHIRVESGNLRAFAQSVHNESAIACAAVRPLDGSRSWTGYGGWLHTLADCTGYEVKYYLKREKPVTGLIGACYALSCETFNRMSGWPETLSWGYNEQAFSLAAHACGVALRQEASFVIRHRFKRRFNYSIKTSTTRVNRILVHHLIFDEKTVNRLWLPAWKHRFPKELAQAEQHMAQPAWMKYERQFKAKRTRTDDKILRLVNDVQKRNGDSGHRANRRLDAPVTQAKRVKPRRSESLKSSITVFCAFAPDREWSFDRWLKSLGKSELRDVRIVAVAPEERRDLRNKLPESSVILTAPDSPSSHTAPRRAAYIASLWNLAMDAEAFYQAGCVVSLEDDVTVHQQGWGRTLINTLDDTCGIAGTPSKSRQGHVMVYRCKSIDPWRLDRSSTSSIVRRAKRVVSCDSVSLCCTAINGELLQGDWRFTATPNADGTGGFGHEWSLMKHARMGGLDVRCTMQVKPKHWINKTKYVSL